MSYQRRGIELYLDGWSLDKLGQVSDEPLTLITELIYPRPRISNRRQSRTIPAESNGWVDWSDRAFHNRVLFKEIVEGPFSVGVTIKRGDTGSGLLGFFGETIRTAGEEATEQIAEAHYPPPISSALEVVAETGFDVLEEMEFSDVVATGAVELSSADSVDDEPLDIDLTAPVEIYNPRPNPHPEKHTDYEEILKEPGESNGSITLEYSIFDR